MDLARAEGTRGGRGATPRRYSPLGPPLLVKTGELRSGASPEATANSSPPRVRTPGRPGAVVTGPRKCLLYPSLEICTDRGITPLTQPENQMARTPRLRPHPQLRGTIPLRGSGPPQKRGRDRRKNITFHGSTLSRGRGTIPRGLGRGNSINGPPWSLGPPDAPPLAGNVAGPMTGTHLTEKEKRFETV